MIHWLQARLSELGIGRDDAAQSEANPVRILLVDDSQTNLDLLRATLRGLGHTILTATDGQTALEIAKDARPQLVILDVVMPDLDGFGVCERLKSEPETSNTAVIFCSGFDDVGARLQAFRAGGVDFLAKPFHPAEVVARVTTHLAVQQLADALRFRNQALARQLALANAERDDALERMRGPLLGESPAVQLLGAAIAQYAGIAEPVLIQSPTGAGEHAVALAIHATSSRSDGPFVSVDCSLIEGSSHSGIFGVQEQASPPSKYVMADGGTLLLLHVDRLSASGQRRLGTLIEEMSVARTEGKRPSLDVRVLAHTAGSAGDPLPREFDAGLRRCLQQSVLRVPALAERRQDVPAIAAYLLERHARQVGKPIERLSEATITRLMAHEWPGNVAELDHVIHQAIVLCRGTVLDIEPHQLAEGPRLGSYRLRRRLGAGGMGEVWHATHELLARPAAVKLIRTTSQGDLAHFVERFRREARATAELRCPNTVTLYDFGVTEGNEFYYVMELLDGLDLRRMLDRFGVMPAARVAHLMSQTCRSLAEAHARGLVHRDIKPANLFIAKLGLEVDIVKVLDFGMVMRDETAGETGLTRAGSLLGTPEYMAPEMARGAQHAVPASDIYSLGITAYEALSGVLPFSGDSAVDTLMKHVSSPPPPLEEVPGASHATSTLRSLIMQCLDKDPAARPSAEALWHRIDEEQLALGWPQARALSWWEEHITEHMDDAAAII